MNHCEIDIGANELREPSRSQTLSMGFQATKEGALLRADLCPEVRANPDDFDIIVDRLGDVRAKKDVQKVKVVKDDDEA